MATLICGSLAFDSIANFPGRFADQILPDQLHILNVSFLVPTLRREFGGCAGNIAYNLAKLGGEPIVLAAIGSDGADYVERLRDLGVVTDHVRVDADAYTAQAFIMTDSDNNQITAFHPGAMQSAHEIAIPARDDLASRDRRARRTGGDAAPRRPTWPRPGSRSSSIRARACRCSTAPSCAPSSPRPPGSPATTTRRRCCASAPGCRSSRCRARTCAASS